MYRFGPELRALIAGNLARLDVRTQAAGTLRHAAVAFCVVPDQHGEACFLLTRRAEGLRAHAAQWALPGGRVEPAESVVEAAQRESEEEIGFRPPAVDVIGALDDYPTRSGYRISPIVVFSDYVGPFPPNPAEVASVHVVPLAELDHPDAPRLITIAESPAPVLQMPIGGQMVHAPTAAVLYQFREVGLHGRMTRVDHFEQPTFAWR